MLESLLLLYIAALLTPDKAAFERAMAKCVAVVLLGLTALAAVGVIGGVGYAIYRMAT